MTDNLTLEKTKIVSKQIKDQDLVDSIINCMEGNAYWIAADRLAECLEVSIQEVTQVACQSNVVLINNQQELTTRQLYKEHTPFLGKLIDTFKNRID